MTLRVHGILERSYANGPGCRAVIWVQGCSIRCEGCCNPGAQDPNGGTAMDIDDLVAWVRSIGGVEGITFSGGEPLQQRAPVRALLREIRRSTALSIVLFTGYDWEHIERTPGFLDVVRLADVVIAGPYRGNQRLDRGLRASSNQTTHLLTVRYTAAAIEAVLEAEVVIDDRQAILTGINDVTLT